jgi:hypothetical protein
MREIFLIVMMLLGQFVLTPERRAAMDQAGSEIKAKQGRVLSLAAAEKQCHDDGLKQQAEKQQLIQKWKDKLGLDSTWSWDDKQGDWVQGK